MTQTGSFTTTISGDTTIVRLPDPTLFDSPLIPQRQVELVEIVTGSPASRVILDLSTIDFVCSTGLGMLVTVLKNAKSQSKTFELCAPQPQVLEVLRVTMFDRLFQIHDSLEIATALS